jgi:hypothetical protein
VGTGMVRSATRYRRRVPRWSDFFFPVLFLRDIRKTMSRGIQIAFMHHLVTRGLSFSRMVLASLSLPIMCLRMSRHCVTWPRPGTVER